MAINYHDGGGNNPYVPDFTDINVDPADLAEFANLLDGDIQAIQETWDRLRSDMESQSDPNFPGTYPGSVSYPGGEPPQVHSGSDGIWEATEFSVAYTRTLDASWLLMRDLIRGLETLRDAARMIHDDYLATDGANAGDLEGEFAGYERSSVIEALGEPE